MATCLRDRGRLGHLDLEATETCIRSAMHDIGATMLEELLNSDGGDYKGRTLSGGGGCLFEFKEYREKKLLTILGPVTVKRAYYYEPEGKKGWCPKDTALDIAGVSLSPGLRRIMSRVGACRPFALGNEDIKEMADIDVSSKEIERVSYHLGAEAEVFQETEADLSLSEKVIPIRSAIPKMYICMDGTGVPVVKAETVGRQGKGEDGQAKAKMGRQRPGKSN